MRKWIKKITCNHKYIFNKKEDIYLSVGDEFHNRISKIYTGKCCKCDKEIELIKDWSLLNEFSLK